MIELITLTHPHELNTGFRHIYEEAFHQDERREWNQLTELIGINRFSLTEIYHQEKFVGFISIWDLEKFNFIEHFAICEAERGKGLGTRIIRQMITRISGQVILEAEQPHTQSAQNRIRFYERLNFRVSDGVYFQPPYSAGKKAVEMLLMSYPRQIQPDGFTEIMNRIHNVVYQYYK